MTCVVASVDIATYYDSIPLLRLIPEFNRALGPSMGMEYLGSEQQIGTRKRHSVGVGGVRMS